MLVGKLDSTVNLKEMSLAASMGSKLVAMKAGASVDEMENSVDVARVAKMA